MKKALITIWLIMMAMTTANAYEFPLVMLKSGGDFNCRNYITENENECTRLINFNNVSMIRTFEVREILVDGHINIAFKTPDERDEFIHRYREYIHPKVRQVKEKHWWEF